MLLDGSVSVVVAGGGVGKSAYALRLALTVAAGTAWGPYTPRERRRVLICNAEDDADELRRRIAANFFDDLALEHVGDRLLTLDAPNFVLLERAADARGVGKITRTHRYEQLRAVVRDERIGFIVLDPLIELSRGLNESDNADMDVLMGALREIAREFRIPILLVHHARKGGSEGGGADLSRGASAIINNGRLAVTLGPLTAAEAKAFAAPDSYCRAAVVKSNYSAKGPPRVLEFRSVQIDNGDPVARLVHVDTAALGPVPFEHWPELLATVEAGQADGTPFYCSDKIAKGKRLDAVIVSRFGLPITAARRVLEQGEAEGRLRREPLPTKYKPEVWRVGPTPNGPMQWMQSTADE